MASPMPFPDLAIRPPKKTPKAGHVVIGYEVVRGQGGCCKCDDLKVEGWVGVGVLCIFCFPCACIPCCISTCHEDFQRPVYGLPSELPPAPNQPPHFMQMMPGDAPQPQIFRIPSSVGPTAPTNAPVGHGTPYPQEPPPTFCRYDNNVAQGIPVNPPTPSDTKGNSPSAPPMTKQI